MLTACLTAKLAIQEQYKALDEHNLKYPHPKVSEAKPETPRFVTDVKERFDTCLNDCMYLLQKVKSFFIAHSEKVDVSVEKDDFEKGFLHDMRPRTPQKGISNFTLLQYNLFIRPPSVQGS